MSTIIDLNAHRPHYVIAVSNGDAHVLPASFVDDVIEGKMRFTGADDWELLLRAILKDWRDFTKEAAK